MRHETVLRLLSEDPGRLESGLVVLDQRLPLAADVVVDLIARDPLGFPVAVLLSDDDPAGVVGRMAAVVAALERGATLLERMFAARGLDVGLRPRFVLLASRFPDQMPSLLRLVDGVEVRALEYRIVRAPDGESFLDLQSFYRSTPAARAPAVTPAPAATEPVDELPAEADWETTVGEAPKADELEFVAGVDAEPEAKRLFVRARGTIRSLSPQIVESGDAGALDFHVEQELLASLVLERQGLRVVVGDDEGGAIVTDAAGLDAALNEVFAHYFRQVGA